MPLYDDFSGDLSKWTLIQGSEENPPVTIESGRMKIVPTDSLATQIDSVDTFHWSEGNEISFEFEIDPTTGNEGSASSVVSGGIYPPITLWGYGREEGTLRLFFGTTNADGSESDYRAIDFDPDIHKGIRVRDVSDVAHFDLYNGATWTEEFISSIPVPAQDIGISFFIQPFADELPVYIDNIYASPTAVEIGISGPVPLDASLSFGISIGVYYEQPLETWEGDLSQSFIVAVAIDARMSVDLTAVEPPSHLVIQPLMLNSQTFPQPTFDAFGRPINWVPTTRQAEVGRLQIVVGGVDVTFFREAPTEVRSWTKTEPFDDASGELFFKQISIFENPGNGALDFLTVGKNVEILLLETGGTKRIMFEGFIIGTRQSDEGLSVELLGALYQANLQVQQPIFFVSATDIGKRIADLLNTTVSRNYAAAPNVTTGITTRQRGSWGTRLTGGIQDLLSTAITDDGVNQWTVMMKPGRIPDIRLKDRTTHHWTVSAGSPGIQIDINNDGSTSPNVIYGQGTASDGSVWRNSKYPNLQTDPAPPYPYNPNTSITVGTTGTGVRTWEEKMDELGYDVSVNSSFSQNDSNEARKLQKARGIQVDGIVGPQTWAATFDVGANGGSLDGAFFMPLYYLDTVEPFLYAADGGNAGKNTKFKPDLLRIERFENYGEGITKTEGIRAARAEYLRDYYPAGDNFMGSITLSADPEENSRFLIDAGENIYIKYFNGSPGMLFHISSVNADLFNGTVSLEVDTKARDLITLTAIKQRKKESQDPARRKSTPRRSRQLNDSIVAFDSESGAGKIPKHALFHGLWTVIRIPAGQLGTIAKTVFNTTSQSPFSVGIFGSSITANKLVSLVGNPLKGKGWDKNQDALDDAGLLISWGSEDQPMGFYPGSKSDLDQSTGRFVDGSSWEWESYHPPWLWIAEYAIESCNISGRLYAAVET